MLITPASADDTALNEPLEAATGNKFPLAKASELLPGRPAVNCIWRWCRRGVLGRNGVRVRLQHIRIGGKIFTSCEWIADFTRQLAESDAAYFDAKSRRQLRQRLGACLVVGGCVRSGLQGRGRRLGSLGHDGLRQGLRPGARRAVPVWNESRGHGVSSGLRGCNGATSHCDSCIASVRPCR
jgi:hypothetical protein